MEIDIPPVLSVVDFFSWLVILAMFLATFVCVLYSILIFHRFLMFLTSPPSPPPSRSCLVLVFVSKSSRQGFVEVL